MSGTQRGEGWGQVEAKTLVVERGGDLLKADAAVQRPIRSGPELQNGKRTLNRASWAGNCVARGFYEGASGARTSVFVPARGYFPRRPPVYIRFSRIIATARYLFRPFVTGH